MSRVALVTGAARGIGAATVSRLVADGYRVRALDSCKGPPLATKEQLEAVAVLHGDRVITRVVDVQDRTALEEAVSETVRVWGQLDVAVAGADVTVLDPTTGACGHATPVQSGAGAQRGHGIVDFAAIPMSVFVTGDQLR